MQVDLKGKVVIVAGAESVVGAAVCKALSENGAKVFAAGLNEAAVHDVAQSCGGIACGMDIRDIESTRAAVAACVEAFGRVDALVNATLIETTKADHKPLHEFDDALWQSVVETQVNGAFNMAKPATAQMVAQKEGGCVIQIASAIGLVPTREQVAHVAASAGIFNFTKAMALELGPMGIRVNAVALGAVDGIDCIDGMTSHSARRQAASPEGIAQLVCFLCDEAASGCINGAILNADDGYTAGYARDF